MARTERRGAPPASPADAEPHRQGGEEGQGAPGAEGIVAMLRRRGARMTATRRATIEVLLGGDAHRHLRAEDIAAEVRTRLPDVAESTIYRTLSALEDIGAVTHVHLGHGPSTFHLSDQDHRHLVCRLCEAIVEVPSEEFAGLRRRLEDAYGFSVSDEHFALVGECASCSAERRDASPGAGAPALQRTSTLPHRR